jgi:hypothetical protein
MVFRRLAWLPLLAAATLACSLLSPLRAGPTATPAAPTGTADHTGLFDCYGNEGGAGAYAGRLNVQPGGGATLKDFDGAVTTGSWRYDEATHTFAFGGGLPLSSARYAAASDTLVAVVAPGASLAHAEGGSLACMRAKPGITGPP